MALKLPERQQMIFLSPSIEQYIPDDAPVRFIDAFVNLLDFDADWASPSIPSRRQAERKNKKSKSKPKTQFDQTDFQFNSDDQTMRCPHGQCVTGIIDKKQERLTFLFAKKICDPCPLRSQCTDSQTHGRKLTRLLSQDDRQRFEAMYLEPKNQETYAKRKSKIELVFGHIKHNLGFRQFALRGLAGVKAEFSLLCSCFNLRRMITLAGGVQNAMALLKLSTA